MPVNAGQLRHWLDIEYPLDTQDSSGEITRNWLIHARVPAAIEPLSAREFIAAQSLQSKITTRIVIRRLDNINATMRVKHNGKIYNIEGILTDRDSGKEYQTLPCSEGINDGG